MTQTKNLALSGAQKTALFMMLLSREDAARLSALLSPEDRKRVSSALLNLPSVDRETVRALVGEFVDDFQSVALLAPPEVISSVLDPAGGTESAASAGERNSQSNPATQQGLPGERIRMFIQSESPSIAARLLDSLDAGLAAEILTELEPERRNQIFLSMVQRRKLSGPLEASIQEALAKLIDTGKETAKDDGVVEKAASVLNQLSDYISEEMVSLLEQHQPEIAGMVSRAVFRFPMLEYFDRASRAIICDVLDISDLAKALIGTQGALLENMLEVLSPRNRRLIDSEMASGASEEAVAAARKRIVTQVLGLIKSGRIEPLAPGKGESA